MKLLSFEEFKQTVNEKAINLLNTETENVYINEIWDILVSSYKNIGGFQSATNKEDLNRKV